MTQVVTGLIEKNGTWWRPEYPDVRVSGRLTYGDGANPFLELWGSVPYSGREGLTIFGLTGSEEISLHRVSLNAMFAGLHGVTSMGLFVNRVIVGAHVSEDATVCRLRVRYTALEDWAQAHSFRTYQIEGGWQTTMRVPPPLEHRLDGPFQGLLRLELRPGASNLATNEVRSAALSQTAWIEALPDRPMAIDAIWTSFIAPCRAILSVCLSHRCEVLQLEMDSPDGERYPLEMWTSQVVGEHRDTPISTARIPFTVATFGLDKVAAWLQDGAALTALLSSAIDAWHGIGFPETRMLQVAAAAEGLHRQLFPSSSRLPKETIKAVKNAAYGATNSQEDKQVVSDALGHLGDLSFRMRLEALVDYCGSDLPFTEAVPWARGVARARNNFAHALITDSPEDESAELDFATVQESIRSLETLAQSVALCIFVTVLRRCGVPAGDVATELDRSIEMRMLVDALQELFPELFADELPGNTVANPDRRTADPVADDHEVGGDTAGPPL